MKPLLASTGLALGLLLATPAPARAGTVTHETREGRSYRIFVPTTMTTPAPVVVLLHGCTQSPDAAAAMSRFEELAETEGIAAIYPEQPASIGTSGCFRWFDPAHQNRGAGEPLLVANAVSAIVASKGLDEERVYVAGVSAGAAMAMILAVTYPDLFAAAASLAGIPYKSAASSSEAAFVGYGGSSQPEALGQRAFDAMGPRARAMPLLVVQGTSDAVVAPINGTQAARQFRDLNERVLGPGSLAAGPTTTGTDGYAFTRTTTIAGNGASVVEHLEITGLGHAWPGGKAGEPYADPKGPDASRALWAFFAPRTRSTPLPASAAPTPLPGGAEDGGTSPPTEGGGKTTPQGPAPSGSGLPATESGCALGRAARSSTVPAALLGLGAAALVAMRRRRALDRRIRGRGDSSQL